ncbi:MAG: hypothetical protein IPG84_12165 [Betaproteobacteria bacterium]|nr:hypothetical protein [Betaproteobacteria bacterium]
MAFRTNGYDLVAALADGPPDAVRYANAAPGDFTPSRIDTFEFDDATLTLAQVQALATDFVAGDSLPSTLAVPAIGTAGADALGAPSSRPRRQRPPLRGIARSAVPATTRSTIPTRSSSAEATATTR